MDLPLCYPLSEHPSSSIRALSPIGVHLAGLRPPSTHIGRNRDCEINKNIESIGWTRQLGRRSEGAQKKATTAKTVDLLRVRSLEGGFRRVVTDENYCLHHFSCAQVTYPPVKTFTTTQNYKLFLIRTEHYFAFHSHEFPQLKFKNSSSAIHFQLYIYIYISFFCFGEKLFILCFIAQLISFLFLLLPFTLKIIVFNFICLFTVC